MTRWDDQSNDPGQFLAYGLCGKVALNHPFADFLSAGLGLSYVVENPCFGLGLRVKPATLDYGGILHRRLGLTNQLTLGVSV